MELILDRVCVKRGSTCIRLSGNFHPGVHLVNGSVGSGKSTLALVAAGLLTPSEGSVTRTGIGSAMLLFQFPEWHITGRTVEEEASSFFVPSKKVLVRAGLSGRCDDDPFTLSRGELKRLLLACVLERQDDLLVLDEPFGALDCRGKEWARREIGKRRREGIVILCTHEQHFLPPVDWIWEFSGHTLACRGRVPQALASWTNAPDVVRKLVEKGSPPRNVTPEDIREAACRTPA